MIRISKKNGFLKIISMAMIICVSSQSYAFVFGFGKQRPNCSEVLNEIAADLPVFGLEPRVQSTGQNRYIELLHSLVNQSIVLLNEQGETSSDIHSFYNAALSSVESTISETTKKSTIQFDSQLSAPVRKGSTVVTLISIYDIVPIYYVTEVSEYSYTFDESKSLRVKVEFGVNESDCSDPRVTDAFVLSSFGKK